MPALASLTPAILIREAACPLAGSSGPFDAVLEWIGDASIVLLGAASSGTHEFFRARATLTRKLIADHGFTLVALEAGWAETNGINRYLSGRTGRAEAVDALATFRNFPSWRWRNAEMLTFAGWLRAFNETRPEGRKVTVHGLDRYDRQQTLEEAAAFLHREAPGEWAAFREACSRAALPIGWPLYETELLLPARLEAALYRHLMERWSARWEPFPALEPAVHQARAADFHRALLREPHFGWNRYSRHLAATVDALLALPSRQAPRKMVVWAHTAHLEDARATDAAETGEASLGQHIRERHAATAFLCGLTTHHGSLTAASRWGGPPERHRLLPTPPGSVEAAFHDTGLPHFALNLRKECDAVEWLREPRPQHLLGPVTARDVIAPETRLADALDAVIHFDETRALEPV